jgi:hypothetical protein
MNESVDRKRAQPKGGTLLSKLNDYKEIITIVVFFLGGVWWIQNRFPTKTDLESQLSVLHCQLDKYMRLTQLQFRNRQLSAQLDDLDRQLAASGPTGNVPLSPALTEMLNEARKQRDDVRAKLDSTANEMQTINDDLAREVCGRQS